MLKKKISITHESLHFRTIEERQTKPYPKRKAREKQNAVTVPTGFNLTNFLFS